MSDPQDLSLVVALVAATLRAAVPVAFAALGGSISERAGVYNVGLEGSLLFGAFGAAAGAFLTGSAWAGMGLGLALGLMLGLAQAVVSVTLRADQLVSGIAFNLFCLGATAFLSRLVFGPGESSATVAGLGPVAIPVLSELPYLGPALFRHDALAYALFALAATVAWVMYRSHAGLALRAAGENPKAADSGGVSVTRTRYIAVVASSVLAAAGGCHLVLAQVNLFAEGMSGGRGFVALAVIILGRWHPLGVVVAALFFGACEAAQLTLQFSNPGVPFQVFLILPYAASILALVSLGRAARGPEAVGKPFDREQR
jgi:general nucleoside transport system permease protein